MPHTVKGDTTSPRRPRRPFNHNPDAVTWARERAGLSKKETAAALGISLSLLSEIEGGTRNCRPALQQQMAELFGCPVVVLHAKGGAA